MNYYRVIKNLYPDIRDDQFQLQDDGKGVFIARWDYSEPQPDLPLHKAAAIKEEKKAQKERKIGMIKARARDKIIKLYPIEKQLNLIMEALQSNQPAIKEMVEKIQKIRVESNKEEAAL